MADKTGIEWTDATWNPIRGCTRVSDGCRLCYAEKTAARFCGPGMPYEGLVQLTQAGPRWTGEVRLIEQHLADPMRWQKPRKIFVNSMSDLFHESLSDAQIARTFAVMGFAFQHTFQVLTKRANRLQLLGTERFQELVQAATKEHVRWLIPAEQETGHRFQWPLPNVWIGVSVEDQKAADARIPQLVQAPAAVRFLSCEPLLGPVDLGLNAATCGCCNRWPSRWVWLKRKVGSDFPLNLFPENRDVIAKPGIYRAESNPHGALSVLTPGGRLGIKPDEFEALPGVDLVIAGGESGPGARPMHPDWARSLRDQCQTAATAFFFKQWGQWLPFYDRDVDDPDWRNIPKSGANIKYISITGGSGFHGDRVVYFRNVGKKSAGRLLDGRTWDEMPGGVA